MPFSTIQRRFHVFMLPPYLRVDDIYIIWMIIFWYIFKSLKFTCFVSHPACVGGSSDATEIFSIWKIFSTNQQITNQNVNKYETKITLFFQIFFLRGQTWRECRGTNRLKNSIIAMHKPKAQSSTINHQYQSIIHYHHWAIPSPESRACTIKTIGEMCISHCFA